MENISDIKKGKAIMAPLFFIGALLCLLLTSRHTDFTFWWLGLCSLAALGWLKQEQTFALTGLSAALLGFCLLLFTHALFFSPAYHANSIYFPATLLTAFVVGSNCPAWLTKTGFKLFSAFIALNAVLALVQWLAGSGHVGHYGIRPLALFSTPNLLATALNLSLVPVLGFCLLGSARRSYYGLVLLFLTALLATQSRGGYLALGAGVLFLLSFAGRRAFATQWRRYRAIAYCFLALLGFFKLYTWLGLSDWNMNAFFAAFTHDSPEAERWQLYKTAWRGLSEHLWLGNGYYNFGYYYEAHKAPLPYMVRQFTFVHNDYLQFAFEIGLLGLGAFLLLIFAFYGQLLKFRQQAISEQRLPLTISAAALTSMLTHALLDYPFYIPLFQAVFGIYLGVINRQFIAMGATHWQRPKASKQLFLGLRPNFIGNIALIAFAAWLALPAIADLSAAYGLRRLQQGNTQSALFWHGVARTMQPYDPNYYQQEGIIWRELGIIQKKPEQLKKSAALFNQGIAVNPFEVNNLLEKIALYRQHGSMLQHPASHQEIMAWINQAKSLQPYSDGVQIEYAHCLDYIGEHQLANEQTKEIKDRQALHQLFREQTNASVNSQAKAVADKRLQLKEKLLKALWHD